MCWVSQKVPAKMVAEEDIPVKKVLLKSGDRYLSPIYRTCEWRIGETRENELDTYLGEANERYFEIHHKLGKEAAKSSVSQRNCLENNF